MRAKTLVSSVCNACEDASFIGPQCVRRCTSFRPLIVPGHYWFPRTFPVIKLILEVYSIMKFKKFKITSTHNYLIFHQPKLLVARTSTSSPALYVSSSSLFAEYDSIATQNPEIQVKQTNLQSIINYFNVLIATPFFTLAILHTSPPNRMPGIT